jgi:hypothetical protein
MLTGYSWLSIWSDNVALVNTVMNFGSHEK